MFLKRLTAMACLVLAGCGDASAKSQPNVVYLLVDNWG